MSCFFFYRCQSVFNLAAPEQSGAIANTAGDFSLEAGVDALCNLPSISQQSCWHLYQCREEEGSAHESEFRYPGEGKSGKCEYLLLI